MKNKLNMHKKLVRLTTRERLLNLIYFSACMKQSDNDQEY
jgi:hypothetical protein